MASRSMMALGLVLGLTVAATGRAALISGWSADLGAGAFAEGAPGSFSFTNSPSNTAAKASYPDITLAAVGDYVQLTLTAVNSVTPVNQWGNIQFRYGLFNVNSQPGITGWLGYFASNSASNNSAGISERNNPNTTNYFSTGGTSAVAPTTVATGTSGTATFTPPGTYAVSLNLTRTTATALQITWSMVQTLDSGGNPVSGVYSHTGTVTDTTVSTFTFNRVGFLATGGAFSGTVALSNIAVIPEPASAVLLGLAGLALVGRRRA